jgi:hypothetical protein
MLSWGEAENEAILWFRNHFARCRNYCEVCFPDGAPTLNFQAGDQSCAFEVLKQLAAMDAQEQEDKAKAFVGTGEAKNHEPHAGRAKKAKKAVPQLVAGKKKWTGMLLKVHGHHTKQWLVTAETARHVTVEHQGETMTVKKAQTTAIA